MTERQGTAIVWRPSLDTEDGISEAGRILGYDVLEMLLKYFPGCPDVDVNILEIDVPKKHLVYEWAK